MIHYYEKDPIEVDNGVHEKERDRTRIQPKGDMVETK